MKIAPRASWVPPAGTFATQARMSMSMLGRLAWYTCWVTFRDRLLATLRAIQPILDVRGVLVAGSEVPNLLEAKAATTLVVSQDVDLAIPIAVHEEVKARLDQITRLVPSSDEPSVWVPRPEAAELIEVNFIGLDPGIVEPMETYEKQDDRLPLMVFGLEKLVSDRTGEKGDRDLLVVAGLLAAMTPSDYEQFERVYLGLPIELRHQVRSNLSILSLLEARPGMPDPRAQRPAVDALVRRLEAR